MGTKDFRDSHRRGHAVNNSHCPLNTVRPTVATGVIIANPSADKTVCGILPAGWNSNQQNG
jgi:hypothetical protein